LISVIFENLSSMPIPDDFDIFAKGSKLDENSPGYGFGLFWARILTHQYNIISNEEKAEDFLTLDHVQKKIKDGYYIQKFVLNNIRIDE
jgi:hypothetical protein